jgi:hypothetical protein
MIFREGCEAGFSAVVMKGLELRISGFQLASLVTFCGAFYTPPFGQSHLVHQIPHCSHLTVMPSTFHFRFRPEKSCLELALLIRNLDL